MKKITKRLMSLGLAVVMATSFAGCNRTLKATSYEDVDSNDIKLVNENGENLIVLILVSKSTNVALDEMYGYINGESFYNIIDNYKEYNLNELSKKYQVYSCKYEDILSDEDYKYITSLGLVNIEYLKVMEKEFYSLENPFTDEWQLGTTIGFNYDFSDDMKFEQVKNEDVSVETTTMVRN